MSLSADQRAILDLLLSHGLGYEAIGAASGIEAAEARARARAGLAALGGADPGSELADFLLGRATTEGRAAAPERLRRDAEANALARRIADGLRAQLERAELPEIPVLRERAGVGAREEGGGAAGEEDRARPLAGPAARLPAGGSTRLIAAVAGVAVLSVLALAVTGAFSDGDESKAPAAEEAPQEQEFIRIQMRPVGEGEATGRAVIGLTGRSDPYLELDLTGLDPAPKGRIHMVWIDGGQGRGLPLPAAIPISRRGTFKQRFELAPQLVPVLNLGKSLELVVVTEGELRDLSEQIVRTGGRAGDPVTEAEDLPERPGAVVLRGPIPDR